MSFHPRSRSLALALVLACVASLALTIGTATSAEAARLNLHRGSHGTKVRVVENRLHKLSLLTASAVDGHYRQATTNAVKRFQRRAHLRVNGRVNQKVWNRLAYAARTKPAPKPKPKPLPPPTGKAPAIVGHRGAVGPDAPENTLAAMRRAATSADVLEMDLRLTADHQIVLMHDVTLNRTTNCTGAVIDWTLQNLRAQCRVGSQPIPTFEEVAAFAETTSRLIAPEIKNVEISDADLRKVFDIINAHDLQGRTVIQSFTADVLKRVRTFRPDLRLMLVSTQPVTVAQARDAGATTVAIRLENLTASDVSLYRSNGLKVWTFTAIDNATLDQAWRIHAQAVITDVPAMAQSRYGA
jgi:glycerophosphoryl diester phosphodiesterase